MKIAILALLFNGVLALTLQAQQCCKASKKNKTTSDQIVITYDFVKGDFSSDLPDYVSEKQKVRIKVENINRYRYAVNVKLDSSKYVSNPLLILNNILSAVSVSSVLKGKNSKGIIINDAPTISAEQFECLFDLDLQLFTRSVNVIDVDSYIGMTEDDNAKFIGMATEGLVILEAIRSDPKNRAASQYKGDIKSILDTYQQRFEYYFKLFTNLNKDAFEYTSPAFRVKGDLLNFKIDIAPVSMTQEDAKKTATIYSLSSTSIKESIPVYSKRGRLSFTAGFFVDGINGGDSYVYQPEASNNVSNTVTDTVSVYRLVQETKSNDLNIGVSSLAHYMWSFGKGKHRWSIGPFVGAGLPIQESPSLRVKTGISLAFGRKEQIVISVGYAATQVKEISSNIDSSLVDKSVVFSDTSFVVPYVNQTEGGYFLAITFNVFKVK